MSRRTAHTLAALVLALGLVGGAVASSDSPTTTDASLGLCCSSR